MRVGLSWDWDGDSNAPDAWSRVLAEIERADQLGYDSVWVAEARDAPGACPAPNLLLTHAARRTRSVQLRAAGRRVTHAHPVRLAEEVAVLDLFSRGRAGIAFASPGAQGVPSRHVQETIDFVRAAWSCDEFRYRGDFVRFPSHTGEEAASGVSQPPSRGDYVPQWERGPSTPDFLAITPKPYVPRPPVYVEISDDETLEWAARHGVSPFVSAAEPTQRAVERLVRYRRIADQAGRGPHEVEATLERRIRGAGDSHALGADSAPLVRAIRELGAATGLAHLVWRRSARDEDLGRFAREVQPLLQA